MELAIGALVGFLLSITANIIHPSIQKLLGRSSEHIIDKSDITWRRRYTSAIAIGGKGTSSLFIMQHRMFQCIILFCIAILFELVALSLVSPHEIFDMKFYDPARPFVDNLRNILSAICTIDALLFAALAYWKSRSIKDTALGCEHIDYLQVKFGDRT